MSQKYKATHILVGSDNYYLAEYKSDGTWYQVLNVLKQPCRFAHEEDALSAAAHAAGINYPSKDAQEYYDYKDRN